MQDAALVFVALVGSLRSGSYTRAIARTLDELAPDEVQVDILPSVGDLPHYNEDIRNISFPEAVVVMSNAIAEADGVIIVTPEYNNSIPGVLKNVLDWLGQLPQQALAAKPVAIQTTLHGMFGGVSAQDHLRQTLASLNAVVLSGPEVIIPCVSTKVDEQTGMFRDEETRRAIALQLDMLAKLARVRPCSPSAVTLPTPAPAP